MKNIGYCILLLVLLASCNGGKKNAGKDGDNTENQLPSNYWETNKGKGTPAADTIAATENEKKAVAEVAGFYSAQCSYSIGRTVSDKGETKKHFLIRVSKSPLIDSIKNVSELSLANVAMIFYSNLREERNQYDEIRTMITFGDGQNTERAYPLPVLDMVLRKMQTVMQIVDLLKKKDYTGLAGLLNDNNGTLQYKKEKLITQIKSSESSLGNIQMFIPYGFVFFKADNQKSVLHIAGMIIREKDNNQFSVDLDPKSEKNEALFVNYKL